MGPRLASDRRPPVSPILILLELQQELRQLANADYQDVLLFAARREKTAHEFYKAMGEMVEDKLTQSLFEMLAAEELRHKYILEKTYEEVVYKDF